MREIRVGLTGRTLDAVLLTQALEQLYGVEPVPVELPDDAQEIGRVVRARRLGGLVVGSPLSRRLFTIRKALDEGVPVLAETPWAPELESIASLLEERMQRPGPPLIPVTPWRFAPDLQLARGILAGGALGDPASFRIAMPGPEALLGITPDQDESLSAAAIVMQQGWVAFDLVRHLFGDVHSLQATRLRGGETAGLEAVEISMRCAGGWNGSVHLPGRRPLEPPKTWVHLRGSEGTIELGWQSSIFVPVDGEAARIGGGCFSMENYERLANHFADVASGRVEPWVTDADLVRTLDLVQAAQMSLGAGLAVDAPRRQRRFVAA